MVSVCMYAKSVLLRGERAGGGGGGQVSLLASAVDFQRMVCRRPTRWDSPVAAADAAAAAAARP